MLKLLRSWVGSLAGLGLLLAAPVARAEQFVLLDVTFTFTKADADNSTPSKSHYYVKSDRLNPETPVDWTQPIDYRNGRIHTRAEVIDKPAGGAETRWTLCYIARKGIDAGYGCSNTAAYTEEGVWDFEQGMTEWWQNDNIDWTQGIKQMDLVMKDGDGMFAHSMPDPERWFPTTLRITMVQVSEGSTYDPSQVPGLPGSGGGSSGGGGGGAGGATGGAGAGGGVSDPISGGAAGGGMPATGGAGGSGGEPSPPAGAMAGGSTSAAGTPGTAGANATSANGTTGEETGCSVSAPRTSQSHLALVGIGLALAAARRRRR